MLFNQVDKEGTGTISAEEAERLIVKLNRLLGRNFDDDDVRVFFESLELDESGFDLDKFKDAFVRLAF